MKHLLFLLGLLLLGQELKAQTAVKKEHLLHSEIIGIDRKFTVYTPAGYFPESGKKYQVLYVFAEERELITDLVVTTNTYLAKAKSSEPLLIVCLYATYKELMPKWDKERMAKENPYLFNGREGTANANHPVGENELMNEHLQKEVFPFIDENYPTLPYRVAFGEQIGGCYVLYDFSKEAPLFQSHLVVNPSIKFYNEALLRQLDHKLAQSDYLPGYLHLTIDEANSTNKKTIQQLEAALKHSYKKGLVYQMEYPTTTDPALTTIQAIAPALLGYEKTIGQPTAAWVQYIAQQKDFITSLKKYYQQRDKWLGYTQLPTEDELLQLAADKPYSLTPEKGLEVLDWALKLYPQKDIFYIRKAQLSMELGNTTEAIKYYEQGLALLETKKGSMDKISYRISYQLYEQFIAKAKR